MAYGLREAKRLALLGVSLGAGLALTVALLVWMPTGQMVAKTLVGGSGHVVVQFEDGTTAVRPITWTGTVSRVAGLQAAGFAVEHSGDAVCSIEGQGCPASNCFCAETRWAQGRWGGGAWDEAWPPPTLVDSDVIAFRYGTQPDYSDWGLAGRLPGAPAYVAASNALEWMRDQQQANGSYDDGLSPVAASVRALTALGAAGYEPDEWGSPSLLHYLTVVSRTETAEYAASAAAAAGKLAVGAAWTGQPVTDFAGVNLPISLTATYSATTGGYGAGSGDTAWAVLGLAAMGEPVPSAAADYLISVQNADGGWAWNEWGASSEVQHTATVVQALLAAGESVTSTEIVDAMVFIASGKNADGGYAYMPPGASDAATSAYVVQALLAAGSGPDETWCSEIECGYLLGVQQPDGSFPSLSPLYATQEIVPALMHRSLGPLAEWSYTCHSLYLPTVLADK
jgi:hypothetical protein